jgi:predicted DNA-binding transcriptional regulator YafY
MPSFSVIRRYYLLYEKVTQAKYPNFNDILQWFRLHDFDISNRTLQRDLMRMRYDFGIEITYSNEHKGYYIDNEVSIKPDVFLHFLEVLATSEMLTNSMKENRETLKYVQFDARGGMKGIDMLPDILAAVKDFRTISFTHTNFHTGKIKEFTLQPYLLKEYLNRWYVIGKPHPYEIFLTFGIDRISKLIINNEHFDRGNERPEKNFEHVVGLVWNPMKVEEVLFSILKPFDNYIKTLPLHSSQKIHTEDEIQTTFSIHVVINHELLQRFLMLGKDCRVISPDSLRGQIIQTMEYCLEGYKI